MPVDRGRGAIVDGMIEYRSDGDRMRAYLARPEGEGPFPGLVVIQEIFGLGEHMKDVGRRLAREGYAALAPDLWTREELLLSYGELQKAREFLNTVPDARVLADLAAAVAHLRVQPFVRRERVGVIGFCMGGLYSLMTACTVRDLRACVVFYGRLVYPELNPKKPKSPVDHAPGLTCPLLGLFGEADPSIPPEHVDRLRAALAAGGKTFAIHTYPGAPHAFFNDERPDAYRPEAAGDAWAKTLAFLAEHLKG